MPDTPFLDRLPEDDRQKVMSLLTYTTYARGEILIGQDEEANDVFFVVEGMARANIFSEDGKIVAFRDIQEGAIFGELAAIDGAPRSASVIAVGDMRVGRLAHADFAKLVDTNPGFTWALLRYLTMQSRSMTDRIFEFSTMLVSDRVVQELLRLGQAVDPGADSVELRPAPTHFDIATRISTHREGVSREMSRLNKTGLTEKLPDGGLRLDMAGLRKYLHDKIG